MRNGCDYYGNLIIKYILMYLLKLFEVQTKIIHDGENLPLAGL